MLNGFGSNDSNKDLEYHQRVADQNIQNIEEDTNDLERAKTGFIGTLAGILLGGLMGWIFLGPANSIEKEKTIPVIRRPLVPAKVQPNEPGGMEIDNQDREVYHIIDNLPKENNEVNIKPLPETPKIAIEKHEDKMIENIESLVENIDSEIKDEKTATLEKEKTISIAKNELSGIQTNSREKIIIPEKIKNIEVKLQDTINKQAAQVKEIAQKKEEKSDIKVVKKTTAASGTWYAQIIASSSRKSVENLWKQLSQKHGFLKTYPYEIEEITAANGNPLYRLKIGVFKTREEAVNLSEKLKQNKISCIIKQN